MPYVLGFPQETPRHCHSCGASLAKIIRLESCAGASWLWSQHRNYGNHVLSASKPHLLIYWSERTIWGTIGNTIGRYCKIYPAGSFGGLSWELADNFFAPNKWTPREKIHSTRVSHNNKNPNHLGPAVLFCQVRHVSTPAMGAMPAFGMGCQPLSAKAAMHLQSSWIGMGISWRYHGPFMVDLPIEDCDFVIFHGYVAVYQRVNIYWYHGDIMGEYHGIDIYR